MFRDALSSATLRGLWRGAVCAFLASVTVCFVQAAPQANPGVLPDATPQVQQVNPSQAAPGAKVSVVILGSNFSGGAYVSSVSPALHVDSSKRISATEIDAQVSVSATAEPSTLSLLVSNPASRAAEAAFKIVAAAPPAPAAPASPAVAPPAPVASPTPASPVAAPSQVAPTPPAAPAIAPTAPASPAAPATPASIPPVAPSAPAGPEVSAVDPPRVAPGFDTDLKITGKNFGTGAKVSFANPGVRVVAVTAGSTTELDVHVKVAHDAAPGAGSLFVINPDDTEAEVPFEVTTKGGLTATTTQPATPTGTPNAPSAPGTPVAAAVQSYDAFHLGNPTEIFQVHGKVKGALVVSAQTIEYQEDGKTLVSITLSDIKEIKTSSIATNTFHITVSSGKTYHFAPGSLRPGDARNLVDTLRKSLPGSASQ
jgi:hypothetical protein